MSMRMPSNARGLGGLSFFFCQHGHQLVHQRMDIFYALILAFIRAEQIHGTVWLRKVIAILGFPFSFR